MNYLVITFCSISLFASSVLGMGRQGVMTKMVKARETIPMQIQLIPAPSAPLESAEIVKERKEEKCCALCWEVTKGAAYYYTIGAPILYFDEILTHHATKNKKD